MNRDAVHTLCLELKMTIFSTRYLKKDGILFSGGILFDHFAIILELLLLTDEYF